MKTNTLTGIFAIGIIATVLSLQAQPVTIGFENFTGIPYNDASSYENPVPTSAQLSDQLLPMYGVRFSSEASQQYVAVIWLGPDHATSGVNGIGGVDTNGVWSFASGIRVSFFLPSSPGTKATTDFVSIRGDTRTDGSWVRLDVFDADGILLGSDVQNDGPPAVLAVNRSGIQSVLITEGSTFVAFDDLSFDPLDNPDQPPFICFQPMGQTNYLGGTARLRVIAAGALPLAYQWRKDGGVLDGKTNTTLILTNVALTDIGDYTVVATNAFGSVTSTVARITVTATGPLVTLIRAVKPVFSNLLLGQYYQMQISGDLNTWTNRGSPFTATDTSMVWSEYFDVDNWSELFFRLQVAP